MKPTVQTFIAFSLAPFLLFGQFNGGNGDGYSVRSQGGLTMNIQESYCSGGIGDGYSVINEAGISMNDQAFYSNGGNGDGYFGYYHTGSMNQQWPFCSGGDADGFVAGSYSGSVNEQWPYSSGGDADGYASYSYGGSVNPQWMFSGGGDGDGYYSHYLSGDMCNGWTFAGGGSGDGFSSFCHSGSMNNQSLFCSGGDGDGYYQYGSTLYHLGFWVWTGITSTSWTETSNWQQSCIPDHTMAVKIGPGCPHYPELSGLLLINNSNSIGSYFCRSLEVEEGGNISSCGDLHVYGDMFVKGSYTATNNTSASQSVETGGKLSIQEPGAVKLGNQESGQGLCDLIVNQGILEIQGGTLEIDDQLNIYSGSTLSMTGGILFAHKYGAGDDYSSASPGTFFIQDGVSGNISGGTVKVAGKSSAGDLSAVNIQSADLDFTGNSTLEFVHGDNPVHYDVDIQTADGADFMNIELEKPGNAVTFISNSTVNGIILINSGSGLKISTGRNVMVKGSTLVK